MPVGRSTFLTCGQDPLDHLRSRRGQARRRGANDAHDYRRQGHLHHERSEIADRPSSMPVRAIQLCRHDPAIPGSWRSGRPASSAAGSAHRHGGEAPAAWVLPYRAPLWRPSPSPQTGGPEGGGTPAPRVGGGCPAGRAAPRQQNCSTRQAGQRVRLPRRRTRIPARLCVLGGPALPQETGSLRLRPPLRDESRQEAWHGRA